MNQEEKQFIKMTQTPVRPLIMKLAVPTIISMLVTAIYNTADTYFVSQLGKSASGAVGVVFSLMAIIQAVGFTLGMGSGSLISRSLGVRDAEKANRYASSAITAALIIGIIITIFGKIFINPLLNMLGATETVLPHARGYATYILFGAPIMAGSFVLNNILRAEGKAKFAMIGLTTGGLLNLGLDPLLIFKFNLGTSGAAIATLISQCVSFILLLGCFILGKSVIKLSIRSISRNFGDYLEIIKVGAPSFCRQGFASIATILLNNCAGVYGDAALSAMSIVSKVFMFMFQTILGIGQGYQPVAGYNFGAKKYDRMKSAFIFTYVIGTILLLICGIAGFIFAPYIIPLFIKDADVIAIGTKALRWQAAVLPLLPINVICNMTFQSVGKKLKATLMSCCRQGIFFIPSVLILSKAFGLAGVEATQGISDLATSLISIPFAIGFYREIKKLEKSQEDTK